MKIWANLKSRIIAELREKIWENEQVLKVRQKFYELDTQTQSYILIGSFAGFVLILLLTFFSLWGHVISLKNEIARMDESIRMAQNSAVRIEELKALERSRLADPMLREFDGTGDVSSFAEKVGTKAAIKKESVLVTAGSKGTAEVKLEKISLRQLARALYLIEKSGNGASLEKFSVDTKDNTEGFLWTQITIRKDASAKGGM